MSRWLKHAVAASGLAILWIAASCSDSAAQMLPARSVACCGNAATKQPHGAQQLVLTVLGSGGPRSAGRAASSYLFEIDGTPRILVDAGPGSFARLGELGTPADQLDTILLTHLHIDHAGDVAAWIKSRVLSASGPVSFTVVGPEGGEPYPSTTTFLQRLFGPDGAYAYLPSFRNELILTAKDLRPSPNGAPEEVLTLNDVTVTAIKVDHGDAPALAYRLDGRGRSFVISGDLASADARIVAFARGADVLVYDTAVLDPPGSPHNLYALHTAPTRIGEVAAAASVKLLVLGHIPPKVDEKRDEVMASIRRSFHGEVRFAYDCMVVGL